VFDQFALFAPARHGDRDFAVGAFGERLLQQVAFRDVVGQKHQTRAGLVVVKLRQETLQNLRCREALVGAREIGAIAPVLPGAKEKHLNAGLAAVLEAGKDIGFIDRMRIDALVRLDMGEGREPVAIDGGGFKVEAFRRLLHRG